MSPSVQIKKSQSTSVQSSMVEQSSTIVSETPHDGTMKAYQSRLDRMKKDEIPTTGFASVLNWAVLGSPDVTPSPARRRPAAQQFPADMSGVKKSGSNGSMANLVPAALTNLSTNTGSVRPLSSPMPMPRQKESAVQQLISPPAAPTPVAAPSTNEANELRYQLEIHDFRLQVEEMNNAKVAAEQQVTELQQEMRNSTAKFTLDFTELEGRLEQARVDLTASQKDAEENGGQVAGLTSTVAELSSQAEQLAQANAALEKQVEGMTLELTSCQNDRSEKKALLTDSSRQLNLVMAQVEQISEKINALQGLLDDARRDLSKCQQDKTIADRQLADMRKAAAEQEGWISDKDKIINQMEELLVSGEKTQTRLTDDLKQQTSVAETLRGQLEKANDDVTNLLKMLEDVGHDMDGHVKRSDRETRALQNEMDNLRIEKSHQDGLVVAQKGVPPAHPLYINPLINPWRCGTY